MEKLSIAHVTEAFAGGVARYMMLVLPAMAAKGHTVTLFSCDDRDEPGFAEAMASLRESGVVTRLMPMCRNIRPEADARALLHLLREIRSGRYDLVHTHGSKAGAIGRLAARAVGVPVVHTPHCYAFLRTEAPLKRHLIRLAERILGYGTSGLIAVSESEKREADRLRLIAPGRCTVVANGLPPIKDQYDREQTRQRLNLSASSLVVTMAARLVGYKGIGLFLETAELCRGMDATFVLAGHGELESWARQRVAQGNLTGFVRVLGHVRDVPELLDASDLCVLCSTAEGQPYALLEAMRGGRPIVATDVPGVRDLVEHGKTGLLVKRDAQDVAQAIRRLATDRALRRVLATGASERFSARHLLDTQVNAIVEAYRRFRRNSPRSNGAGHRS